MTNELLAILAGANLAASAAVLGVLALRLPVRRLFGARLAYGLWAIVPAAFLAALIPRKPTGDIAAVAQAQEPLSSGLAGAVASVWLAGALAALAWTVWMQLRFLRSAARGQAGPAVVGVFAPRMVVPADHQDRHSLAERALIRAHERAHIDRGDTRANALIAFGQCLNWFNPLIHLAAHYARIDQELACDATVVARHPRERRRYAETMLKIQLAPRALPLGCHWTAHPLETRIAMLAAPELSDDRERAGGFALISLAVLAAVAAWFVQPARTPLHQPIYFEPYPTVTWRCWPTSPDPSTNRCTRTVISETAPDDVFATVNLRPGGETIVLPPRRAAGGL